MKKKKIVQGFHFTFHRLIILLRLGGTYLIILLYVYDFHVLSYSTASIELFNFMLISLLYIFSCYFSFPLLYYFLCLISYSGFVH